MEFRKNPDQFLPYEELRTWIGVLGMALPVVLALGGLLEPGAGLRRSISLYWHSNMRDFFVGLMFATALFLFTYRGYDWRDRLVAIASGLAGLALAFFPCVGPLGPDEIVGIFRLAAGVSARAHLASAAAFFILLAVNSTFLFRLSDKERGKRGRAKDARNAVYLACGLAMFALLAALALVMRFVPEAAQERWKPVFLLETLLLQAFGISWLVKGGKIIRDRPK
ncbi:MAG: hypothetical protein JXA15_09775 [Spirochaetales bacterium]|nr:hypothetical protein [Spirochaetales bacterium]